MASTIHKFYEYLDIYICCDWLELVTCLLTFYCDPYFLYQIRFLYTSCIQRTLMGFLVVFPAGVLTLINRIDNTQTLVYNLISMIPNSVSPLIPVKGNICGVITL